MPIVLEENAFLRVLRALDSPFSEKEGGVFFEPVSNMVSHFRVLPDRHRAMMEELCSMHHSTFSAPQDYAPVIVIVLEIGWPIVRIEQAMLPQCLGADHKAGEICAVRNFAWINLASVSRADS